MRLGSVSGLEVQADHRIEDVEALAHQHIGFFGAHARQRIGAVLVAGRFDDEVAGRWLNRTHAAFRQPRHDHPMVAQIQAAVLIGPHALAQAVEQEHRLWHRDGHNGLAEHILAQRCQQFLARRVTARYQQVDDTVRRVQDRRHRQGWAHIAPDGAVVRAKLQAALQVVLDADVQLHTAIEMARQHIDLAGTRAALLRRESQGERFAQAIDVLGLAMQHLFRWQIEPAPAAATHLCIGTQEGLGDIEALRPVGQCPQGTLGVTGVVLEVLEHRIAQRHGVA